MNNLVTSQRSLPSADVKEKNDIGDMKLADPFQMFLSPLISSAFKEMQYECVCGMHPTVLAVIIRLERTWRLLRACNKKKQPSRPPRFMSLPFHAFVSQRVKARERSPRQRSNN